MKKETRKVKIYEANHVIIFRGRPVRTPVTLEVTDKEFDFVMMNIQSRGILKYDVEEIVEKEPFDKDLVMDVPQEIDEVVAVEEFEGRSTLERILEEK
jgi:hypothetical protein